MKKVLSILLTVVMIIAVPSICLLAVTGNRTEFKVQSVSAEAGSSVEVNVTINNNPGVLGAVMRVEYDSALTLTGAVKGDAFSALEMTKPGRFQTPCQFAWDGVDLSSSDIMDGTVLTLTFDVPASAAEGTQYSINISANNGDIIDKDLNTVNAEFTSGSITVGEGSVTPPDPIDPPTPVDGTVITAQSISAPAGSTVDFNIDIQNNPGIIGATLKVTYDNALTLVDASKGDAFSSLEMTKPGRYQSPCQFTWDGVDISASDIRDGTILTLSFEVPSDAQDGDEYAVSVSGQSGDYIDKDLNIVSVSFVNGSISVAAASTHVHSYEIVNHIEPDCVNSGLNVYECECGDSYVEELEALGHQIVIDEAVAPTCQSEGLTEGQHCSRCGAVIVAQQTVPAGQHSYVLVNQIEPDCENAGLYIYECTVCGDSYIEEPAALGHQIVIDEAVAPTCQSEGLTEGQHCSRCGAVIVAQQTIPVTDHNYEVYRETVTCVNDGYIIYRCSMCKTFNNVRMSAYGHNYVAVVTEPTETEGGFTTYTCSRCGDSYISDYTDPITPSTIITGVCGDNVTYTYDASTKVLTIRGTGDMYDYNSYDDTPFYSDIYRDAKTVIVEEGVTSIGNHAFDSFVYMTSLSLPDSLISIGSCAFETCVYLSEITIPANVTSIQYDTFLECDSVASITVASGNTKYDSRDNCNAIIETASNKLIYGCASTVIPQGIKTIGEDAFCFKDVNNIIIPRSVTKIESGAFEYCRFLSDVYFEGSEAEWNAITIQSRNDELVNATIHYNYHNYVAVVTEPTCITRGYTTYSCTLCGKTYKDNYINALGHNYAVSSFSNNSVCVTCQRSGCNNTAQYDFFSLVGAEAGNDAYVAIADVNSDGIINGRDLAVLKTQY